MPPYMLSQLATRYNPQAPKFTTPEFSSQEDYQNAIKFAQEQERLSNLKAYGAMAGRAKVNEDVSAKKAKIDAELKLLRQQRATALEGTPFAVSLDQKIAALEEQAASIQPDIKTVLDATRLAIAPENSGTLSSKNPAVMAEKQAEIDSRWVEINKKLRQIADANTTPEQRATLTAEIDALKSEAINLGREYTIASQGTTYKSPYEDDYYRLANATKNLIESEKSAIALAVDKDKIIKDITDDAASSIKSYISANQKVIDGLNLANGFAQAFDFIKGTSNKSPAAFAALVKTVNKLIEPNAAVMADDMKTMAKFGGGEETMFDKMVQIGNQMTQATIATMGMLIKSMPRFGSKTVDFPGGSMPIPTMESGADISMEEIMKTLKQEGKEAIASDYLGQWDNIVKTGETFKSVLKGINDSVQNGIKNQVKTSADYAQFRNANALAKTTGKTVQQLISEEPGKSAWDNTINQSLNAQLMGGFAKFQDAVSGLKNVGSTTPTTTETPKAPETPAKTPKPEEKKPLSTDEAKKKLEAEKAARAKAKAEADKKRREEAEKAKKKLGTKANPFRPKTPAEVAKYPKGSFFVRPDNGQLMEKR